MLTERLKNDLKSAMKSGEAEKVGVLRFVLAQCQNREKDKQGKGLPSALEDVEVIDVLQKEAKRRREALSLFRQGGREDIVAKEEAELKLIETYLPQALNADDLAAMVDEAIRGGASDFGSMMREVMKKAAGRADGRAVGEIIKKRLE